MKNIFEKIKHWDPKKFDKHITMLDNTQVG
jgi:hypothetical protein